MEDVYEKENVNSDSAPTQEASNSKTSGPTFKNSESLSLPGPSQLTEEEEKAEILDNYVTDLSNFQEISFKIKNERNEDKSYSLYPNANFENNKKGFYIFYNDNLEKLKEFYNAELKRLKKENPFILYHISEYLDNFDPKLDQNSYRPDLLLSRIISYGYQNIVDRARSIAKNINKINEIEKHYGKDLNYRICEFVINDDKEHIFDDFISCGHSFVVIDKNNLRNNMQNLSERIKNLGNPSYYLDKEFIYIEAESQFRELGNKYKDKLTYITELEKLLDVYLKEFGENVTEIEKVKCLCFILNRASYYLSKTSEQLLAEHPLDILRILYKLRRKITKLLLTYRYKFEQNKRPLLDIPIERYKSIIETFETTSIYIETDQVKKFIVGLEDALERKGNNLREEKKFEPLSITEIRSIVSIRDGNLSSNEKIKEAIEVKIDELEEKISSNKTEIAQISAQMAAEVVGIVPGQDKKKAMERVNQLLGENKKLQKELNSYKNKLEKLNINQNYDVEFINILKLYSQLYRKNYYLRVDYSGIILAEKRKMAKVKDKKGFEKLEEIVNLREYEIKEISKNN